MEQRRNKREPSRRHITIAVIANVIIITVIAVMSVVMYRAMLRVEEDRCWGILQDSAEAIEKEIKMQVESNVNILRLVAGAMVQEQRTGDSQENLDAILSHLNDFQDMTIFARIDLLMANGSILLQTGELRSSTMDFQAIAEKGVSISGRRTDVETGKEVIRCSVPVVTGEQTVAILLGVVNCEELPETLNSSMYDGEAYVCLVDHTTGDFIMDNWHDSLGNLFEMPNRKMLPGYEHIDVREEISQGNTGVVAYESNVNGKASYMYFRPVANSNWHIIVVAQEDVVFRSLHEMKRLLGYLIGMIGIMLASYLAWSLWILRNALKKAEESEKCRYLDSLTGLYNQNKFTQTLDEYEHMALTGIGLLFLDLNGLKYTNDHFGHAAGDQLLINTARILSDSFGTAVYRIGGDEFVALTSELSHTDFVSLSAGVKRKMQEKRIEAAMGITWHATSSTVKAQLKEADDLMYTDKRSYHERNTISHE